MRINNVQSNQNFGMALKINSKLYPEIEKSGLSHIKKLENLDDNVKNVKMYDVCLEKDAYDLKIRSANPNDNTDYLGNFRREESNLGKWHEFTCNSSGCEDTYGGYNPNEPQIFRTLYGKNAADEYKKFKEFDMYKQIGELSKLLEKRDKNNIAIREAQKAKKAAELEEAKAGELRLKEATNDLMDKYKADFPEEQPIKENLFRRIVDKFIGFVMQK